MSADKQSSGRLTPLMRQFHDIKKQHPDKILFFRMGDFYEMFGDDAIKAAPILGITLTSRSHGESERIPLAGVPHHSADRYLARMLKAGLKVVIVEQVEDPKTAKGLVKREVIEILTPGTATVDAEQEQIAQSTLAAVMSVSNGQLGLAVLDINTGGFVVSQGGVHETIEQLRVSAPTELLIPDDDGENRLAQLLKDSGLDRLVSPFGDWNFDASTAERELNEHFGTETLAGFGVTNERGAVACAGAILRYLKENHRDQLKHISKLTRYVASGHMAQDYSSVRNLELVQGIATGDEKVSLLGVMNKCLTPGGTRLLRQSLLRPFTEMAPIQKRQSAVAELVRNRSVSYDVREALRQFPDLARLTSRLGIGKINPRQMSAVAQALEVSAEVKALVAPAHNQHLVDLAGALPSLEPVAESIRKALVEEPPLVVNKGKIFQVGYSKRLDEFNDSIRDAREYIGSLQKTERERTGIPTLKVGFNKVFGYYLEVTKAHSSEVPDEYIRKQTLVNAERYITPELKEKEELILAAEEKISALELELYEQLVQDVSAHITDLQLTSDLIAELDLSCGLAELAVDNGYCRPEIFEDTRLVIENGRHPVVEAMLPAGSFVGNDLTQSGDDNQIIILTGPNMSGKSTYLRQLGLIVIMAQIGSFVPADRAQIGLVDRVFTRVGAMDNLAGGQSTFLVEMVETANILHNAGERSLVLLDEVGRGTSTFDGLSVAWSVVEHIHDHCKSRTVFATHYHELTGLSEMYDRVANFQVAVKKWQNEVIFLHKIVPGGCDDSYGIEVARLAGVPRSTLQRARQILRLLESGKFTRSELGKTVYKEKVQTTLFDAPQSEIEEEIRNLDLDQMSPMQAFDLLKKFKKDLQ